MTNLRIVQVPGGYALRQVVGNGYLLGVNNSVYLTYAKAEAAKRWIEARILLAGARGGKR